MTLKYLSGDRISGLSGDTKPTNVPVGSMFLETDTADRYVLKSSGWTQLSSVTTVPQAVTSLTATANSISQITVAYSSYANDGISGYKIEKSTDNVTYSTVIASTAGTSYAVTGLSTYTDYYFRVSAINSIGTGATATSSITKTQGITPTAVTSMTVTAASTTQLDVAWTASSTGTPTPTYKVEYKASSSGTWLVATASQAGVTYSQTGLIVYTEYDVKVTAFNPQGSASAVTVSNTRTSGETPGQVTGLTLTDNDPDVGIVWSAISATPSVTYTLEESLSSTFASGVTVKASGGTGLTYTDASVTKDVAHYYRVKAVNAAADGAYSATANITIYNIGTVTGGTVRYSGGYTYHDFLSSGNLTISTAPAPIEIFLVGGGGRAGGHRGGGGGGGGIVSSAGQGQSAPNGVHPISVGAGGSPTTLTHGSSTWTAGVGGTGGKTPHTSSGGKGGAGSNGGGTGGYTGPPNGQGMPGGPGSTSGHIAPGHSGTAYGGYDGGTVHGNQQSGTHKSGSGGGGSYVGRQNNIGGNGSSGGGYDGYTYGGGGGGGGQGTSTAGYGFSGGTGGGGAGGNNPGSNPAGSNGGTGGRNTSGSGGAGGSSGATNTGGGGGAHGNMSPYPAVASNPGGSGFASVRHLT